MTSIPFDESPRECIDRSLDAMINLYPMSTIASARALELARDIMHAADEIEARSDMHLRLLEDSL